MSHGVQLEFEYPALPDRVWDALTNPAKLAAWFLPADLIAEEGHRFTLRPDALTGLAGPIAGEVLAAEPPQRLVLELWDGRVRAELVWQVEPARGGSRLRVTQSQLIGGDEETVRQQYTKMFGDRLAGVLRGSLLGRMARPAAPQGPVRQGAAINVPEAEPAVPVRENLSAVRAEPPDRDPRRPYRPRLRLAVGVALGLGLAIFGVAQVLPQPVEPTAGPDGLASPTSTTAGGVAQTNTGPGATQTVSASVGPTAAASSPRTSGHPPATTPPGQPNLPALTVNYTVTNRTLLGYKVAVTLHNPANDAQSWTAVRVGYDGLNLAVGPVGTTVRAHTSGSTTCFSPAPGSASIGAGENFTFSYSVTAVAGLLSVVTSASLETAPC